MKPLKMHRNGNISISDFHFFTFSGSVWTKFKVYARIIWAFSDFFGQF